MMISKYEHLILKISTYKSEITVSTQFETDQKDRQTETEGVGGEEAHKGMSS